MGWARLLSSRPRSSNQCFGSWKESYLLHKRSNLWGFSWVCGPRQKDFGLEGCGRRMSDTWSSEIQKFIYGVMFQSLKFQKLAKLKKVKGLGWILPSDRRLPHHRSQDLLSELQSLPWFRSVGLGFDCYGLWFKFWMLGGVLARICRAGFSNYARIWEFVSSSVQSGSGTLLLRGLLLVWISSALGYL